MKIRDIKIIKEEIANVDALIIDINNVLAELPNDTGFKLDLDTFQQRKKYLVNELACAYKKRKLAVMNMRIQGNDVGSGEMPIQK